MKYFNKERLQLVVSNAKSYGWLVDRFSSLLTNSTLCNNLQKSIATYTTSKTHQKTSFYASIAIRQYCSKIANSVPMDSEPQGCRSYDRVCLGGTFDNLHSGHKVLLGEALRRCNKSMTIGVTATNMIQNKILWELIAPVEDRITKLHEYLISERSELHYNIVPITDPFGPAIEDDSLECIIVSKETIRGANKINEIRLEKSMKELAVVVVDLVSECCKQSKYEEDKVSSSSQRIRKLGTLLKEPTPKDIPSKPYLIGLTGGIASGTTHIAEDLESLGADVIDCDKAAHEAYNPGSNCYQEILAKFAPLSAERNICESNSPFSPIDRKKLGAIVFGNDDLRQQLNNIVWPETRRLVLSKIEQLKSESKKVIVVEAALLLEANWHENLHQVWTSIIPEQEAIKRLKERNNLSEEAALQRIKSQKSNYERVQQSNVIFCSLWDRSFTREQVEKAWNMLNERFL